MTGGRSRTAKRPVKPSQLLLTKQEREALTSALEQTLNDMGDTSVTEHGMTLTRLHQKLLNLGDSTVPASATQLLDAAACCIALVGETSNNDDKMMLRASAALLDTAAALETASC